MCYVISFFKLKIHNFSYQAGSFAHRNGDGGGSPRPRKPAKLFVDDFCVRVRHLVFSRDPAVVHDGVVVVGEPKVDPPRPGHAAVKTVALKKSNKSPQFPPNINIFPTCLVSLVILHLGFVEKSEDHWSLKKLATLLTPTLFQRTFTWSSLSGRLCSWAAPRTWRNSWTTRLCRWEKCLYRFYGLWNSFFLGGFRNVEICHCHSFCSCSIMCGLYHLIENNYMEKTSFTVFCNTIMLNNTNT